MITVHRRGAVVGGCVEFDVADDHGRRWNPVLRKELARAFVDAAPAALAAGGDPVRVEFSAQAEGRPLYLGKTLPADLVRAAVAEIGRALESEP